MPIKLRKSLRLALVFFLALIVGNTRAEKLNIVTEHLAPFQVVNGKFISGLSTEIVESTLEAANLAYTIEAHPWSLSYQRALKEKNTCIYSIVHLPERDALFQWVGKIASSSTSLYSLSNSKIKIKSLEHAKKFKIAVIKDDVAHHYLMSQGFIENKNLYVMNNNDALLKILQVPSRQIDLVVINDDLLNNRVHSVGEASKYKNVHTFENFNFEFYLACSLKTNKAIVNALSQAMKKLETQGGFNKIKQRWQHRIGDIN